MKKTKKTKSKSIVVNVLIIFTFSIGIIFMYLSLMTYLDKKQVENETEDIKDIYYSNIETTPSLTASPINTPTNSPISTITTTPIPTPTATIIQTEEPAGTEGPTLNGDFIGLLQINKDVVGWISMEGTNIDYAVLLGDDNDYYLKRDIYEKETRAASIFMDYRNNIIKMNKNTILYGHNLDDGTMFSDLVSYVDHKVRADFIKKFDKIVFNSIYENMTFEIFSAYVVNVEGFQYLKTSFKTDEDFLEYVDTIRSMSLIYTNTTINEDDKIITLSTCNHWFLDSRTVIHAKLITD